MKQENTHTHIHTQTHRHRHRHRHRHIHTHTNTHTHTHQMYTKNVPYAKFFLPEKACYSEEVNKLKSCKFYI